MFICQSYIACNKNHNNVLCTNVNIKFNNSVNRNCNSPLVSNVGFILIICNAHLRYTVQIDRRQPSAGLEVNEEAPFLQSQLWAPSHIFRATHTQNGKSHVKGKRQRYPPLPRPINGKLLFLVERIEPCPLFTAPVHTLPPLHVIMYQPRTQKYPCCH